MAGADFNVCARRFTGGDLSLRQEQILLQSVYAFGTAVNCRFAQVFRSSARVFLHGIFLFGFGLGFFRLRLRDERSVVSRRYNEHHKSRNEQAHDGYRAEVYRVGQLGDNGYQHGADKRRALAEYIHYAEQRARMFCGYYLGEVGAGERLYAALEQPDHDGEHPELPHRLHEYGERAHKRVCAYAYGNKQFVRNLTRKFAEYYGRGEGHNLRNEQRYQESRSLKSQRRAEGGGHVYHGVNTVDIQEEGDEEEYYSLSVGNAALLFEYGGERLEVLPHGVRRAFHKVRLLIRLGEGNGERQPPRGVDYKCYGHRYRRIHREHEHNAYNKGYATADIAPGIAL